MLHDRVFDSVGEFSRFCEGERERLARHWGSPGVGWIGGTLDAALASIAAGGDAGLASKAGALLEGIKLPDMLEHTDHAVLSVGGGSPCMGAWAAGAPEHMVVVEQTESNVAPIRVFLELGAKSDVSHDDMLAHAMRSVAVAQALSMVRPVEVWACWASGTQGHASVVRVRVSSPFSVAEAAMLACGAGIARGVGLGVRGFACGASGFAFANRDRAQGIAEAFAEIAGREDAVIPGLSHAMELSEHASMSRWVEDKVRQLMEMIEPAWARS
jgi:hypothetical protein